MEFREFSSAFRNHADTMMKSGQILFVADVDKDKMWETYLNSFPAGSNEIYRERREHDCSACRHFIKAFGNVVVIVNNKMITAWDFEADGVYKPVAEAMAAFIRNHKVTDVFVTKSADIGVEKSHEECEDGKIKTWNHFFVRLPSRFVCISSDSEASERGKVRDVRNVFKRSLDEISQDSVLTILELIAQNSLYKGEEWEAILKKFNIYQKEYAKLSADEKENYAWITSIAAGPVVGKIRGHSIGTLLLDVSEGVELNEAVRKYEALVAPSNYKRPKAIFTQKMLEAARAKIEELGFLDSLGRRYAVLDDITINNILFANKDSAKRIAGADVFESLSNEIAIKPKNFDKVEEASIEAFMKDILPTAKKLEVLLENRHTGSMVSLIAPKVKDSKTMFKWGNGFSWAYSGNVTDSMKERVKAAGGKVDGVLRFSIQWNDDEYNPDDFDAHCIEPDGNRIYFGAPISRVSGGTLDVDIRYPKRGDVAVENITWADIRKMKDGVYSFLVHNYANRGGRSGFSAEIEFDGQIFSFVYNKELKQSERIDVAVVTLKKGKFTIQEKLPSSTSSRKVWGLDTNQFYPVSVLMYSPNYWDAQDGIGHRHYFFMLKGCVNEESPNGFFNEYLKEELLEQKRVFEALGSKMRVEDSSDQLSGLGFSSTKRNSVVCRVEGHSNRVVKILF